MAILIKKIEVWRLLKIGLTLRNCINFKKLKLFRKNGFFGEEKQTKLE